VNVANCADVPLCHVMPVMTRDRVTHVVVVYRQVMTDDNGKSRGFGFVGFEDHESAQKVSPVPQ